jgi:hypothetical protein
MNAAGTTIRKHWEQSWPLWVGLLAVALEIFVTTPVVQHATEENEVIHDSQHGLIMVGGMMMGYAVHDLTRGLSALRGGYGGELWPARALSARGPLLTIAGVFLVEVVLISPPVDHFTDRHKAIHYAVHGAIFFGGVVAGAALGEARRRGIGQRRGSRA